MARCPKCGGKIEDDLMGCLKCGYKPYFEKNRSDYDCKDVFGDDSHNKYEHTFDKGNKKADRTRSIFDTNPEGTSNSRKSSEENKYLTNFIKSNIGLIILAVVLLLFAPTISIILFVALVGEWFKYNKKNKQ